MIETRLSCRRLGKDLGQPAGGWQLIGCPWNLLLVVANFFILKHGTSDLDDDPAGVGGGAFRILSHVHLHLDRRLVPCSFDAGEKSAVSRSDGYIQFVGFSVDVIEELVLLQ
ncbi:MAG TPA: hypothetical protein VLQ45_09730 [Thermoanaerobaculia bacterium]|nr:hypothetical protein [Thermoanaerobaculia bacterium]